MSKKTYADECLERAERAGMGPWFNTGYTILDPDDVVLFKYNHADTSDTDGIFVAHARTDVPELARRLKRCLSLMHAMSCDKSDKSIGGLDRSMVIKAIKELKAPIQPKETSPVRRGDAWKDRP